jgi:hypothetical protein
MVSEGLLAANTSATTVAENAYVQSWTCVHMVHLLRAIAGTCFAGIEVAGYVHSVARHFSHIESVGGLTGRSAAIEASGATRPM